MPDPPKARGTLIVLGLLVLGTAAILLWRYLDRQPATRVVMGDGTEVILRAVTVGTNHSYVAGNLFQRVLAPFASSNLSARLGIKRLRVNRSAIFGNEGDTLVCWLEVNPK